jgi:N-methylhydantoinase A/oxoprolinase/acetone carboxylase beta subunit
LNKIAALRITLPGSASLTPFVDWPKDLAVLVNEGVFCVAGGNEFDGQPVVPLDEDAVVKAAHAMRDAGITSVGITASFSPLNSDCEDRAAEIVARECPGIRITCSHALGRIGLLERENATLLNAALLDLADDTAQAFRDALDDSGIKAPLYITLNDGTVTSADIARKYPVYCFASGPTNSMRGAAFLSGIDDAIVCDVGGTTADIGCLATGFPREANNVVEVGGVRTLFRMPDLVSIGIGGGTKVDDAPLTVGPESVGFRLPEEARVFGGSQLTLTDVAVAKGLMDVGDKSLVKELPDELASTALEMAFQRISDTVDRMKIDSIDVPLIAVGGGAALVPEEIPGISKVHRVPNHAVANAVGAAIAQISGEADQVFQDLSRDAALEAAHQIAVENAVKAGADRETIKTIEMEDLPLAYLPGHSIRARVRVVGDIARSSDNA